MTTTTTRRERPAVQRRPPSTQLLKLVNPLFIAILRSRAHRLLAGFRPHLLVLGMTGRRTGRRYTRVVGAHDLDGRTTIVTSAPWRWNLRGGAEVDVTEDGRTRRARAVLVEDPAAVTDVYARLIERIGLRASRRELGVRVNVPRAPTRAELRDAVERDRLAVIRLEDVRPAE